MLTVHDIKEQREQLQQDVMCILDGYDQTVVDNICQDIVDKCNYMIAKLNCDTLNSCKPGNVISIVYGDNPEPRVCRVMDVRDTQVSPVCRKTYIRRNLPRQRYLLTCQDTQGRIRSFYAGNEKTAKVIGLFGRIKLWAKGQLPPKPNLT
jgi:hypothetical protein